MHYFQQRYIREAQYFPSLTGLLTIDLPNKGLLSGIEFKVWGTNGDDEDAPDVWLHDRLKKIEVIVNGSQVVKSLDGRQLLAMMCYKKTPVTSNDFKNMNAAACDESFYINLGRHYHDLEYMLDLGQVADPELRIEYDFALADCSGYHCGEPMTAEPQINIVLHMLRDTSVVPKGYIKTSEIHRVDNAANLGYNLTVPRGPTYSNLYLQSWWYQFGLGSILDHVEVNINSDNLIPYRQTPGEMANQILRMYGLIDSIMYQFHVTGGQAYPFPLEQCYYEGRMVQGIDALVAGGDLWGGFNVGQYTVISTNAAGAATVHTYMNFKGIWPFSVSPIPLFDPWDPDTWIDTSVLGDFWVRIEENAGAKEGVMKLLGDEVVTKYTTPSWP